MNKETFEKLEKSYQLLFKEREKHDKKDDNEVAHYYQDKVYRKLVRDICNGNLGSLEEIKMIASQINKNIVKHDKGRWYA